MPSHGHSVSGNTGEMSQNSSGAADLMGVELLRSKATGNMSVSKGAAGWGGGHNEDYPENVLLTIDVKHTHSISGTAAPRGSGTAHNNMTPYIVKYCWERIA